MSNGRALHTGNAGLRTQLFTIPGGPHAHTTCRTDRRGVPLSRPTIRARTARHIGNRRPRRRRHERGAARRFDRGHQRRVGCVPRRHERTGRQLLRLAVEDITLPVGALEETVRVTAESPLVDTTSTKVGGNIGTDELNEIPSMNRNYFAAVALLPGCSSHRRTRWATTPSSPRARRTTTSRWMAATTAATRWARARARRSRVFPGRRARRLAPSGPGAEDGGGVPRHLQHHQSRQLRDPTTSGVPGWSTDRRTPSTFLLLTNLYGGGGFPRQAQFGVRFAF